MLSQQTRPGLADAVNAYIDALSGLGATIFISYPVDCNAPALYGVSAPKGFTFATLAAMEAFELRWGQDLDVRAEVVAEMECRILAKRRDDLIARYIATAGAAGLGMTVTWDEVEGLQGLHTNERLHLRCATPEARKGLRALGPIEESLRAIAGGWDYLLERLIDREREKGRRATHVLPAAEVLGLQAVA